MAQRLEVEHERHSDPGDGDWRYLQRLRGRVLLHSRYNLRFGWQHHQLLRRLNQRVQRREDRQDQHHQRDEGNVAEDAHRHVQGQRLWHLLWLIFHRKDHGNHPREDKLYRHLRRERRNWRTVRPDEMVWGYPEAIDHGAHEDALLLHGMEYRGGRDWHRVCLWRELHLERRANAPCAMVAELRPTHYHGLQRDPMHKRVRVPRIRGGDARQGDLRMAVRFRRIFWNLPNRV